MKKHNHYFKDVSKFEEVDVYRVCELFEINDPSGALHHAIKKLLCSGKRGAGKDALKDVTEAIDTLTRYVEMKSEAKTGKDVPAIGGIPFTIYDEKHPPAPHPFLCRTQLDYEDMLIQKPVHVYITREYYKELEAQNAN